MRNRWLYALLLVGFWLVLLLPPDWAYSLSYDVGTVVYDVMNWLRENVMILVLLYIAIVLTIRR